MHKLVVLYPPPTDRAHFARYYVEKHLPLVATLPNLRASRHSLNVEGAGAPAPYFAIWEGEFDSEASMGEAMQSEIGQAIANDAQNYASGGAVVMHYEVASAG
ncbi:EthD family reductase [Chitinasiproducens palmae]|uniref:EthD domain-containing protein n=1 Tax=Chitinasiproducens palmae TaxID=1770053 RepID=A0A1H2PTV9_9BURK|nr:EthD family reductase [Chitinasiproducens palmae]SDV50572.1 conserved hypothetical protein [Chitinasiproducens palmae]